MSDEMRLRPEITNDEECARTQRDRSTAHAMPPRGVALSVLWWLEADPREPNDPCDLRDLEEQR